MANGEGFFCWAIHFLQEYLLYFKEKWNRTAGKDPLLGYVDGFQIDPNILIRETWPKVKPNFFVFQIPEIIEKKA